MDEPTSNLDAETEKLVVEGLRQLTEGRTSIIIAHRPSTIQHATIVASLTEVTERETEAEATPVALRPLLKGIPA